MNMNGQNTIINIGRQFGSGGKLIALKISETLGVPVYDNELISKAADESGFSKELFERSDEKRSIFNISSFFGTGRFGETRNYVGDNELFKIQSEVIRDIAAKGPAIFVGRCVKLIPVVVEEFQDNLRLRAFGGACEKGFRKIGNQPGGGPHQNRKTGQDQGDLLQFLHFRQLGSGV